MKNMFLNKTFFVFYLVVFILVASILAKGSGSSDDSVLRSNFSASIQQEMKESDSMLANPPSTIGPSPDDTGDVKDGAEDQYRLLSERYEFYPYAYLRAARASDSFVAAKASALFYSTRVIRFE